MLGLNKNSVALAPYNKDWERLFLEEKERLSQTLGNTALLIEHVGSTSVAGLSAKPIIDIAVAVQDASALYKAIPVLKQAGYDVLDNIQTDEEVLARKGTPDCRTHYIHVEIINNQRFQNHILFRNYLRTHIKARRAYEELKRKLAAQYGENRKAYTAQKADFIQEILKMAQQKEKRLYKTFSCAGKCGE